MKTTVIDKYILLYNSIYIQYTILCSHVAPNSVLFAESVDTTSAVHQQAERSFSKRRMEGGIADETCMPPFKFECFGSAA